MSLTDPIADMLTRIRNAQSAGIEIIELPSSNQKAGIAGVLKEEGYIADFEVEGDAKKVLRIALKYDENDKPVIRGIRRESTPGLRRFCGCDEIPRVLGGLGIAILSTNRGIMAGHKARRAKLGGEIICSVW
ncbi:MAG: 30S ribosomal protein S8 [Kiritimatiellae bacterium]|nr:30S ribosomal protein S8 [Kiritimatiellia bacterium]